MTDTEAVKMTRRVRVKRVHMGASVNQRGQVSALCYRRRRPIDLRAATWTNRTEAVTCPACRAALDTLASVGGEEGSK